MCWIADVEIQHTPVLFLYSSMYVFSLQSWGDVWIFRESTQLLPFNFNIYFILLCLNLWSMNTRSGLLLFNLIEYVYVLPQESSRNKSGFISVGGLLLKRSEEEFRVGRLCTSHCWMGVPCLCGLPIGQCHLRLHYLTIWEAEHFSGFFPTQGFFAGFSICIINFAGRPLFAC